MEANRVHFRIRSGVDSINKNVKEGEVLIDY